jgi:hypothetical protein
MGDVVFGDYLKHGDKVLGDKIVHAAAPAAPTSPGRSTLLVLSANPSGTTPLLLDSEHRHII